MARESRKIRYAVIGAGNIAQVAVLPAFAHAKDNSELVAVISGDGEKRAALRERYGFELDGDYDSLESVIERGAIDAVYVATPNSLHKEFAFRAAEAGVHVLCEKPLAPSVDDCRAIIEACQAHDVKLMVAYRLHFDEATLQAMELARSGRLGDVRLFSSFFTHVVRGDDIRRDPTVAGGATLDLGVYCINAARHLFDAEPIQVVADAVFQDQTDDTLSAILRFPEGRIAQFCVSNSVAGVSSYRIAGTEGDLRVEPGYAYAEELVHYLTLGDDTKRTTFRRGDQFAPELKYFSDCLLNGRDPEPSGEEGWCDVRVVEALLESARTRRPIELPAYVRAERPSPGQSDHEPPVKKPEPIAAPSPSVK
jgi:predicted dehydrogenase